MRALCHVVLMLTISLIIIMDNQKAKLFNPNAATPASNPSQVTNAAALLMISKNPDERAML